MLKTLVGGWANTTAGKLSFNTLWNTQKAGTSTSSQITVPTSSTGTYSCTVYWGDGTSNAITTYNDAAWTHTFPAPGVYSVSIVGVFKGIAFANGGDCLKIISIMQWGGFSFGNTGNYFQGCANLTIIATDIPGLVGTTSMGNAFRSCGALKTVPGMGLWDMSSITSMVDIFVFCGSFNENVGAWNVSSVTNFTSAFQACTQFNQPLGSWNVSNATNLSNMFSGCSVFNGNISAWNTAKVNNLSGMFTNAAAFNQNISSWNTGAVTNMSSMFSGATSFNQNIGAWNITKLATGATGGTSMFAGVTLSNANYNGLLAGWGAQVPISGVTFSGGNSHYDTTSGGFNGTAGRAVLTGTYTWVITDGGTP